MSRRPGRRPTQPANPWSRRERGAGSAPGQGLVELAFALPVMLLLLLGTVDVGRLFFDYIQLRGAVVEGATYGSRHPTDTGGITAAVLAGGVPTADVSVAITGDCTTPGQNGKIIVSATRTFTPVTTGFLQRFGLGSVSLAAGATTRCLT